MEVGQDVGHTRRCCQHGWWDEAWYEEDGHWLRMDLQLVRFFLFSLETDCFGMKCFGV